MGNTSSRSFNFVENRMAVDRFVEERLEIEETYEGSSRLPLIEREPQTQKTNTNIGNQEVLESIMETRIMENMMRVMNVALTQQQEKFTKMLNDHVVKFHGSEVSNCNVISPDNLVLNVNDKIEEADDGNKIKITQEEKKRKWKDRSEAGQKSEKFNKKKCIESSQETKLSKKCFKCGEVGHMAKDCSFQGIVCYECKEIGHVRRNCPKLKDGGNSEKKFKIYKGKG